MPPLQRRLVLFITLAVLLWGIFFSPIPRFTDFKSVQTGSQCLVDRCNPYDSAELDAEIARRNEPGKGGISADSPAYPPSTLLLALPFQGFGWPLAGALFDALSGLALLCAALVLASSLPPAVLSPGIVVLAVAILGPGVTTSLRTGNPALLAAALATIASLILLGQPGRLAMQRPSTFGWIALGLAIALKPQLVLAPAFFLVWKRETRNAALRAIGFAAALLLLASLAYRFQLGSFHFLDTLHRAISLSLIPGGPSDASAAQPGSEIYLNLEALLSRLPVIRSFAKLLSWAVTAALAAATWQAGRLRLQQMPWTLLALSTVIGLLPVYHNRYDRVVVLLLVPAAVELMPRPRLAWVFAALSAGWLSWQTITSHLPYALRHRPLSPVFELALCACMLVALHTLPVLPKWSSVDERHG